MDSPRWHSGCSENCTWVPRRATILRFVYGQVSELIRMARANLTNCKRNIEMTPLCKVEVTLPRVLGSREVHRGGGGVDEQAGVQPS
jgi:hypothetical protein